MVLTFKSDTVEKYKLMK